MIENFLDKCVKASLFSSKDFFLELITDIYDKLRCSYWLITEVNKCSFI